MIIVMVLVTVLLSMAAVFALTRLVRGPSLLDRAVAVEVLVPVTMSAVGADAAIGRTATTLPILVVLAILAFVGSVAVVQSMGRRQR